MNFKPGQKILSRRTLWLRAVFFIIGILALPAARGLAGESQPWVAADAAGESAAPESQPYGIETEWGDVLRPDGTVKKKPGFDIPPKNVPPTAPKLKRARPGEIRSVPGTASDVEEMLQLPAPRTSEPTLITDPRPEIKPEPEPEKPKVKEKPKPKPEPEPEASQPEPPIKPLPKIKLANTSSFTLDATEIIYDPESKTLRASHAVYDDNLIIITADEIRMDLSRTLLAAEGNVLVSTDDNEDHRFIGDFALMNYRTSEGEVRFGKDISWFSLSFSDSFDVDVDEQYVYWNVQPLPAAGAPSLGAAVDVVFSPRREQDTVRARYMTASAGNGLTFYGLTYNDTKGKPARLPIFNMANGEWRENKFQLRNLSFFQVPSIDSKQIRLQSQYFLSDNPHGKSVFSAVDEIIWSKNGNNKKREHDFQYSFSKQYIRGDNVLNLYTSRYDNYLTSFANYGRYWFPGHTGFIRFSINGNISDSEEQNTNRSNESSLWLRRNSRSLILDVNISLEKEDFRSASRTSGGFYQSNNSTLNTTLSIRNKPTPVLRGKALLDLYSAFQMRSYYYSNEYYNYDYNSDYTSKTFRASLFGKPMPIFGGGALKLNAIWEYGSFVSDRDYGYSTTQSSSGDESADASARFSWDIGGGELGADYIATRENGGGAGNWAAYFALTPSDNLSIRVSARYLHERTSEGLNFPENVLAETADLSFRINRKMHLVASFDLDNYFHGAMLNGLALFTNLPSGNLSFYVIKFTSGFNGRYYYAPYQYALSYYFSR